MQDLFSSLVILGFLIVISIQMVLLHRTRSHQPPSEKLPSVVKRALRGASRQPRIIVQSEEREAAIEAKRELERAERQSGV